MRYSANWRRLGATVSAWLLVAGSAVATVQAAESTMTVGVAAPGFTETGAEPGTRLEPSRGTSWGPGGYLGNSVPIVGAARPAPPLAPRPADDFATADDGWGDGADAQDGADRQAGRGYPRVGRGGVVPAFMRTRDYFVTNWRNYGLGQPGYGHRWIRYYDDALLIDSAGRVLGARYDLDWGDGGAARPVAGGYYQENADRDFGSEPDPASDPAYGDVQVQRSGANAPNVTVRRNPDGSTTVTVVNDPQVTTTTHYGEPVELPPLPPEPVPAPPRRYTASR